ncbi:MAG: hypothetical protein J4451_00770 [DPANN group archaeon]|nr:hypothetical protein [DPANN group archaeon]
MVKHKSKKKVVSKTAKRKVVKHKTSKAKSKTTAKVKSPAKSAGKMLVGSVVHFFDKISVAVIDVKRPLSVGDTISIEGPQTNFKQNIKSMQIEHSSIKTANKGDNIGMKTNKPVKSKDLVYILPKQGKEKH